MTNKKRPIDRRYLIARLAWLASLDSEYYIFYEADFLFAWEGIVVVKIFVLI